VTVDQGNFGLARICALVGISKVRARQLVRDKILPQNHDGTYNLSNFIRAWNDWKQSSGTSPKRKIEEERARKLKRENDRDSGELMPMDEVRELQQIQIAIYNLAMDAMPGRIAAVASMKEPAEVEAAVRLECSACTERIRNALQELLDEIQAPQSSTQSEESQDD
jgi:hypothetical protein